MENQIALDDPSPADPVEATDETLLHASEGDATEKLQAEDNPENDAVMMSDERYARDKIVTRVMGMFDRAIDEDKRQIKIAVSSEEPVERGFGTEILDHREGSVDLSFMKSGRAPLLLDHDPTKQIGVVEEVTLDGKARRLRATVRLGKGGLASEVFGDIVDGIRANISVGYIINKMDKEGADAYRATSWTPLEVSVVSIPADRTVGVGRAAADDLIKPEPKSKEAIMADQEVDLAAVRAEAARAAAKEAVEMLTLGAKHQKRDLAEKAIAEGKSIAEFRGILLNAIGDTPLESAELGLSKKEVKDYSLMRALRDASTGRGVSGYEREISEDLAKRHGREARGFFVPTEIFKRDLTVGTNTAGGFLKGTDHLANEFIDALRPNLVMASLGARMMGGLRGDIAIPALNAKTAVGFVAENAAPGAEGAPTFRQVTMSPKTVLQYVDLSRKLMMQSDPSVEAVIRQDMMLQFAAKIDEVAIEGGGSNEPTGITLTAGIGSVAMGTNGGAITYAKIAELEREVAIDNALVGRLSFLTNPKVVGAMRTTPRQTSGVEGNFILNDSNTILGYGLASTNLVPSDLTKGTSSGVCSALIFGNFAEVMIGLWGGLDVLVDPYTGSSTGATRVAMYQDVDVAVRHAESFAAILDITT